MWATAQVCAVLGENRKSAGYENFRRTYARAVFLLRRRHLTIAKAYFTTTGTYSFAVVTDDGLYFAVAVNYEYDANGLANRMEANNGSWADNTLTVSGESDYLFKDFVDLTQEGGVSYTLDISKINGYYKSGLDGSKNAYIALSFYDMFSGNTIMLKLYANDTEESGAQMAYVELLIRDKNNKPVYMGNTAIEDEKNYFDESIMTKNVLTFSVENNALCVELNGDYSLYLDLGDTVLTTLQLSVASTAYRGVKLICLFDESGGSRQPRSPAPPKIQAAPKRRKAALRKAAAARWRVPPYLRRVLSSLPRQSFAKRKNPINKLPRFRRAGASAETKG
ncbi:MAG: hypothetical protein ACLRSW_10095 [Christensenellaceae bacterium]